MGPTSAQSAIFIVPRSSSAWKGAEAIWVTIAGWALAAEKVLGKSVVVTTDRIATPSEVFNYPRENNKVATPKKKILSFLPPFLRILIKDLIRFIQTRRNKEIELLQVENVSFIWEQHDLFIGKGKSLSIKFKAPLVKYVHAPIVWEASKWGVKRYFWGNILERFETKSLKRADVVLVVSKEVRAKLLEMGVDEEKIFISPMGVTPQIFSKNSSELTELQSDLELENNLILGWVGSFRGFHGIDQVVKAFSRIAQEFPGVKLMLVGDGPERKKAELLSKKLHIKDKVIFTGKKKFLEIPRYIALFDIAIVSAASAQGFHYSPLKLREYWASGKAVIAPKAGEIVDKFENDVELKLFMPGNIEELASSMTELIINQDKRNFLARNGKAKVLKEGTWEVELEKLLRYLQK